MTLAAIPRDLREGLALALGHLRRNELDRAIPAMTAALRRFTVVRLPRAARLEVQRRIREFLAELAGHPRIQPLLSAAEAGGDGQKIPYHPGREDALIAVLNGLYRIAHDDAMLSVRQQAESAMERKKALIETGVRMLREGQVGTGAAFLWRVAAEFGDGEPAIRLRLGQILIAAGQFAEAGRMYEAAMQAQPRETAAYTAAVDAWLLAKDYARAESVYQAILRTFGGHPATFGRMAAMYLAWGKLDRAREMAGQALKDDPAQADALAVMASLRG